MSILLSVSATDLDIDALQQLTIQLCQDLRNEADIQTSIPEQPATHGTRGDIVTIGQILIAAVGAGGPIVALINVLRAYSQRKPSLQFELQTKDGDIVKITADDLRSDDMKKLLQAIKPMIESAK
jgi:Effector Associated Constant Component 1